MCRRLDHRPGYRAWTMRWWLHEKLRDLLNLVAYVRLKKGGHMFEAAIIRSLQHPDNPDYDLPTGKSCTLAKDGSMKYWGITFSVSYSKLFLGEIGVHYPSLMPARNSMSGEAAAIARFCLSQNFVSDTAQS